MVEIPNISAEQKEKNKQYIFDHFDEYVVDIHGNYVNIVDFEGTYGTDYFYISKNGLTTKGIQEIENKRKEIWQKGEEGRKKAGEKVLRELENWELVYYVHFPDVDDNLRHVRHKQSGIVLDAESIDFESFYKIIGELGYRRNIWKDYEETIKLWKKRDEEWNKWEEHWKNLTNNNNNQHSQPSIPQQKKEKKSHEHSNNNHKNTEKINDLKNKFHELYQKGKKYSQHELMMLTTIINEIEKEIDLDNNFQEVKSELQIIINRLASYQPQVYLVTTREGETSKAKLKGLNKHELENCKKALEEIEKLIHLSEQDNHLLEVINDKLKVFSLQSEIEELKNNKTTNPQQQAETQKKITEKEQELEKLEKDMEKRSESNSISQEITIIKTQILQTLKKHNLKTSNLPKEYQDWEEHLSKLDSKEKINSFLEKMNQQIEKRSQELKRGGKQQTNNNQQLVSSGIKLLICGGLTTLIISGFLVLLRKKRKFKTV